MFANRTEAGQALAKRLTAELGPAGEDRPAPVVIALPRGGIPVAREIADALDAPLDIVLVRKVGLPWQPELAVAAVVDSDPPEIVRNERIIHDAALSELELSQGVTKQLAEIGRRRALWLGDRARPPIEGRTVIVVDDGIATGSTARAALRALRRKGPAELILAVPVAPRESLDELAEDADRIVCLETPSPFWAVGAHYRDFRQIDDDEVAAALPGTAESP